MQFTPPISPCWSDSRNVWWQGTVAYRSLCSGTDPGKKKVRKTCTLQRIIHKKKSADSNLWFSLVKIRYFLKNWTIQIMPRASILYTTYFLWGNFSNFSHFSEEAKFIITSLQAHFLTWFVVFSNLLMIDRKTNTEGIFISTTDVHSSGVTSFSTWAKLFWIKWCS